MTQERLERSPARRRTWAVKFAPAYRRIACQRCVTVRRSRCWGPFARQPRRLRAATRDERAALARVRPHDHVEFHRRARAFCGGDLARQSHRRHSAVNFTTYTAPAARTRRTSPERTLAHDEMCGSCAVVAHVTPRRPAARTPSTPQTPPRDGDDHAARDPEAGRARKARRRRGRAQELEGPLLRAV